MPDRQRLGTKMSPNQSGCTRLNDRRAFEGSSAEHPSFAGVRRTAPHEFGTENSVKRTMKTISRSASDGFIFAA
jgi:hypothetical protein